jgi:CelD/BcsL family acetyltransferase involved in cellulose biosynthesis
LSPETVLRLCGLSYFHVQQLHESQRVYGLRAQKVVIGRVIRFGGSGAQYWTELRRRDPKFVADTERRERQLIAAEGPVTFRFREAPFESALSHLIDAKRQQYKRTGVADALGARWRRELLYRLAEDQSLDCSGVVSSLYAGSTWVASHFGILGRGVLYYCLPVYNPALSRFAPGRLLIKAIIHTADQEGLTTIDRCGGDSQAKRDFANASQTFFSGAWHRPSLTSLGYRGSCSVYWRLSAAVRALTDVALSRRVNQQQQPTP